MKISKSKSTCSKSLKYLGVVIITAAIGLPWIMTSAKDSSSITSQLASHFGLNREKTFTLDSDRGKSLIKVLKGFFHKKIYVEESHRGAKIHNGIPPPPPPLPPSFGKPNKPTSSKVESEKEIQPRFHEFASKIYVFKKISIKGYLTEHFQLTSDYSEIEIDAPHHPLLTGEDKQIYYFNPKESQDCFTKFEIKWDTGKKVDPPKTTDWFRFSCQYLAMFSHGKYYPPTLDGKVPIYHMSASNRVYAITKMKNTSGFVIYIHMNKMVSAQGDGNWSPKKMELISTKPTAMLVEGKDKEELEKDLEEVGFFNYQIA